MPQQQIIPWWLQYQGMKAAEAQQSQGGPGRSPPPFPSGTPFVLGGETITADKASSDAVPAQGPTQPPNFSNTGVDIPPATGFNPNANWNQFSFPDPTGTPAPTPPFQNMTSAGPGLDFFPANNPNPPPNETGFTPQQPSFFPPDTPPDFSNLPTNPPTNETATWTPPDTYFGGNINPTPDVPMIANPNDLFFPPDMPPNFSNIPANIPPNESMIAQPVPPDATQSGLSLSSTPDLSIAGDNTVPVNNYYPDGSGGYVVYDSNWNVVTNMPGTGSQSDPSGAGLATNTLGFPQIPDQQSTVTQGDNTTPPAPAPPTIDNAPPPPSLYGQFLPNNSPGQPPLGSFGIGGMGGGFYNSYIPYSGMYDQFGNILSPDQFSQQAGAGAMMFAANTAGQGLGQDSEGAGSEGGLGVHGNYALQTDPGLGTFFGGGSGGRARG